MLIFCFSLIAITRDCKAWHSIVLGRELMDYCAYAVYLDREFAQSLYVSDDHEKQHFIEHFYMISWFSVEQYMKCFKAAKFCYVIFSFWGLVWEINSKKFIQYQIIEWFQGVSNFINPQNGSISFTSKIKFCTVKIQDLKLIQDSCSNKQKTWK